MLVVGVIMVVVVVMMLMVVVVVVVVMVVMVVVMLMVILTLLYLIQLSAWIVRPSPVRRGRPAEWRAGEHCRAEWSGRLSWMELESDLLMPPGVNSVQRFLVFSCRSELPG